MKPAVHLLTLLVCLVPGALVLRPQATSADQEDHEVARHALTQRWVLPLPRILDAAAAAVPGTVLEVELEREHGVWIYEVKIVTARGRMVELELDAATAQVLRVHGARHETEDR